MGALQIYIDDDDDDDDDGAAERRTSSVRCITLAVAIRSRRR